MSTALEVNAAQIGKESATFIEAFRKEGRVYGEFDQFLDISMDDFRTRLKKALMNQGMSTANGVHKLGDSGGITIDVEDQGGRLDVTLKLMADPFFLRAIEQEFKDAQWERSRKEGVYDINISHWYLDKTRSESGEMKAIEHYRNTESFNKLTDALYPQIHLQEMMEQYSNSDECIFLLSGQPGTGKTCFAKLMMAAHALTQKEDMNVVYAKDKDLLKKDQFWAMMSRQEPDIIILDDLDNELLPRGKDGNEIVSNMLSYSDGIFDVDTKIIITTNLTDSKIDKAIVRPGRSFDTLCLPQLTSEEAQKIWVEEFKAPATEFNTRFEGLENVSQAALVSEHQRFLKSNAPTYLKDPSISVRKLVEEGETINHDED
ncbi:ATPase [Vibrio phage D148]